MFRKLIFIALGSFAFSSHGADMPISSDRNLLSDTAPVTAEAMEGGEAEGFYGSFELKYTGGSGAGEDAKWGHGFSYRTRASWKGEVNEAIKWGLGLSSQIAQNFDGNYGLQPINLEQAYVAYKPADGFYIKAGKFGWRTHFHKTGIFYDDDLYAEGAIAKFHHSAGDNKFFVKAGIVKLQQSGAEDALQQAEAAAAAAAAAEGSTGAEAALSGLGALASAAEKKDWGGPFSHSNLIKAMAGGHFQTGDIHTKVKVGVQNDALFKKDGAGDATTLVNAGLKVAAHNLAAPVGVFALYSTNTEDFFKFKDKDAYTAGVFVGKAGCSKSAGEANEYAAAISYYTFGDGTAWNTALADTDYANSGKGIAVKGQYNVWDNTSIAAKYAHGTGDTKSKKLVGELTFNF